MALQFFSAAVASPSGASAGIFIPRGDLDGVTAGEFGSGVSSNIKTSKAIAALINTCERMITGLDSALGFTFAQQPPSSSVAGTIDIQYQLAVNYLVDFETNTLKPVPVATSGANSGMGDFAILDVFPNADIVAANDAIASEGIVIPFVDLTPYGMGPDLTNIASGQDNRLWVAALYRWLASTAPLRATGTSSAIVARSRGNLLRTIIPASWTATTDPESGLLTANLPKIEVFQQQYNITINYLVNQQTQTFDVNVV